MHSDTVNLTRNYQRRGIIILFALMIFACSQHSQETTEKHSHKRSSLELQGATWQWQSTRSAAGEYVKPTEPKNYTITFGPEQQLSIRADCNRGGGSYNVQARFINIKVTHTTRAMCADNSLESNFIESLNRSVAYHFQDNHLFIKLQAEAGVMKFQF